MMKKAITLSVNDLIGKQRISLSDFSITPNICMTILHTERNLPPGFPRERKLHELVIVRLTQFLMHQTLRLSWFSFWSPSEGDYLLNPEVKYNFTDHIWAAVGAMLFGNGEAWSQFGQLDRNDNVYVQIRYEF